MISAYPLLRVEEKTKYYVNAIRRYLKKGSLRTKVRTVRLILLNSEGKIYVQKRSKNKKENPGLYDKSVAGHVWWDSNHDDTVIRKCGEELGINSVVVSSKDF